MRHQARFRHGPSATSSAHARLPPSVLPHPAAWCDRRTTRTARAGRAHAARIAGAGSAGRAWQLPCIMQNLPGAEKRGSNPTVSRGLRPVGRAASAHRFARHLSVSSNSETFTNIGSTGRGGLAEAPTGSGPQASGKGQQRVQPIYATPLRSGRREAASTTATRTRKQPTASMKWTRLARDSPAAPPDPCATPPLRVPLPSALTVALAARAARAAGGRSRSGSPQTRTPARFGQPDGIPGTRTAAASGSRSALAVRRARPWTPYSR